MSTFDEENERKIDPWCRHLPQLHRLLADPVAICPLPRISEITDLFDACAYWETLHYLLHTLLGWQDPGAGLAWRYATRKPDMGDSCLRLVRSVWDVEGQLDYYAAWQWAPGAGSSDTLSPTEQAKTSRWPDEEWWRILKRRGRPYPHDPFHGGTNPLHLGHSDEFGRARPPLPSSGFWDPEGRRAVLVVAGLASWRRELLAFGERLPVLGDRSWHVEIFDRATGYLGKYRRSRVTGL